MVFTKVPKGKCPKCDRWNMVNMWGFAECSGCSSLYEPKHVWQPPIIFTDSLDIIFTFGKHKGEPVRQHLDYAAFIANQDWCPAFLKEQINIIKGAVRYGRL